MSEQDPNQVPETQPTEGAEQVAPVADPVAPASSDAPAGDYPPEAAPAGEAAAPEQAAA